MPFEASKLATINARRGYARFASSSSVLREISLFHVSRSLSVLSEDVRGRNSHRDQTGQFSRQITCCHPLRAFSAPSPRLLRVSSTPFYPRLFDAFLVRKDAISSSSALKGRKTGWSSSPFKPSGKTKGRKAWITMTGNRGGEKAVEEALTTRISRMTLNDLRKSP